MKHPVYVETRVIFSSGLFEGIKYLCKNIESMVQELNSPGEEQEAHYSHLCVLREGSRCPYSQR